MLDFLSALLYHVRACACVRPPKVGTAGYTFCNPRSEHVLCVPNFYLDLKSWVQLGTASLQPVLLR